MIVGLRLYGLSPPNARAQPVIKIKQNQGKKGEFPRER